VVQLVADVGHLEAADDLAGLDVEHGDRVR
jgi:hypothetical protein